MSKSAKVTKSMIVNAAIELIRNGQEVSARNISGSLGISTMPIYTIFSDMEKLKSEIFVEIGRLQKEKIASYFGKFKSRYKAYGMGFVKFAKEEKELFKYLFLPKAGEVVDETQIVFYDEIINEIQNEVGVSATVAKQFHLDMSIYTYGLAVLQSLGSNISDEEIGERLQAEYFALKSFFINKDKTGEN